MKKIFMVFSLVCACCFVTNVANADYLCRLTSCVLGGHSDDSILSVTGKIGKAAENSGDQCYRCNWGDNDYECYQGTVLGLKHPDYETNGEIIGIYKCEDEGNANDKWVKYNPTATCPGSLPSSAKNTRSFFSIYGGSKTGYFKSNDGDSLILESANDGCVWYVCKDGYKKNADNTDCISIAAEQEAQKRQKQEQERQKREQQNQIRSKKDKCENSGGSWTSGKCVCNKAHMIESGGVCVCESNEYEIKNGYCEMKDFVKLQKACEAASGTTWNPTLRECKCNASTYSWNGTQCVEREEVTTCKSISGAIWNNGCMCTKSGYIIDYASKACIEDPDIVAKNKIIAAGRVLDGIAAGFDVSVWKNAQGEFNTARLASDSIAGVVLGTVGGVVTSSVMKKHQVEDGFEDLKCTIGGQTVAGWGDEFNVGIQ